MKKFIIIALAVIVGLVFLGLLRDNIIKSIVEVSIGNVTGARAKIGGLSLGLMRHTLKINNFRIYNPKGFPKEVLLDMPKIYVDLDVGALMQKKLHFPSITIDLKELVVVKNKEGKLNVDSLRVAKKEEAKEPVAQPLPLKIDTLTLSIGRVVSKDYTGEKPVIEAYDVDIKDRVYKNITSAKQLTGLVLVEAMKPTAIRGAQLYSAVSLAGVAFLPAGIGMAIFGKDNSQQELDAGYDRVFDASIEVIRNSGKVLNENRQTGMIKAGVEGADVTVNIEKINGGKTKLTISARKFFMPEAKIAAGLVYQVSEKVK